MKILDRYVLRSFLVNYLISFLVLIGMYIVLDMVFNFDELVQTKGDIQISTVTLLAQIARHYFFQSFLIFVHLSGIIPVVAAAFTLIRMSRTNEVPAILAAGVPLLRVAAPIIFAAMILQGLLAVDQELIIPNIIMELTQKHDEMYQQAKEKWFQVKTMQDDQHNLLFVGRYTPASPNTPASMNAIDIVEYNDSFQPLSHTTADWATWDEKQKYWKLTNGLRVSGLLPTQTRAAGQPVNVYKSNITPDELALFHSGDFVNLLSRERINELLQRRQVYGAANLLRVKHFRLSQLVMNVIMLLVAIPCVVTREPGKMKSLLFRCLVLVGLCMASYFIAYQIAASPPAGPQWADKWPAIMAFVPIVIFGAVAVFLLDRLATKDT